MRPTCRLGARPFFLQIGGFDGVSFDPLRPYIVARDLAGLIVEPVGHYFEKLKALYAGSENVMTANYAVSEQDGARTMWRINPEAVARGLLEPHFAGISSFVMGDLLSATGVLGRSSPNAETTAVLESLVQAVTVQCHTIDSLLAEFGVSTVDILQIDTEGYDLHILRLFDFDRFRPGIVHYEHQHLSHADRIAAVQLLQARGYQLTAGPFDTLAVLEQPKPRAVLQVDALRKLAASFQENAFPKDAIVVLEHLHSLDPADVATLRRLVRALDSAGRTIEAMRLLTAYRSGGGKADVSEETRTLKLRAFALYNAHCAAGELQQALLYISSLAALLLHHIPVLEAAFDCARRLGRTATAADHAITILNLDPMNTQASSFISDLRSTPKTAEIEIARPARFFAPRSTATASCS